VEGQDAACSSIRVGSRSRKMIEALSARNLVWRKACVARTSQPTRCDAVVINGRALSSQQLLELAPNCRSRDSTF
jgi:hypothetical protein